MLAKVKLYRHWIIAFVAGIFIFFVPLLLFKFVGLFNFSPNDDNGAKVIAAGLALFGALVSSIVAIIGILVKFSIDDRNSKLAEEAGERNRIEIALRAVNQLGENNQNSSHHKIAGSLLALKSLGQTELATSLLAEIWSDNEKFSGIASSILKDALSSKSTDLQITAGAIILKNWEKLYHKDGTNYWPLPGFNWPTYLPNECRIYLIYSLSNCFIDSLDKKPSKIPEPTIILYYALSDGNSEVSQLALACLVPYLKIMKKDSLLIHPRVVDVDITKAKEQVEKVRMENSLNPIARDFEKKVQNLIDTKIIPALKSE